MKKISFFILFFAFLSTSFNVFAGDYYIHDVTRSKKEVWYEKRIKVAELVYSYGWKVYCERGRKRGNAGRSYSKLKTAYKMALSECKR